MTRFSRKYFLILPIMILGGVFSPVYGQQNLGNNSDTQAIAIDSIGVNDYFNLTLPPLHVLFENAKSAPTYELALVEEEIERRMLRKERRAFLGFFSIRGSWQYGKYANDMSYSDVSTPIIYTYNSAAQSSYSVGAAINIKLDELFDLSGRVKRQKLRVRAAELMKEKEYEIVKKEIAQLYATVIAQLNILKLRAESTNLATVQYSIMEKNFTNGTATSGELASQKEDQSMAIQRYEDSRFELNKSLLVLEVITNTPIIRK